MARSLRGSREAQAQRSAYRDCNRSNAPLTADAEVRRHTSTDKARPNNALESNRPYLFGFSLCFS